MSSNDTSSSQPPSGAPDKSNVTLFLVPLSAVIVVGFVALWLNRRLRERKLARQRSIRSPTRAIATRGAMERDLEAAWVRGASRGLRAGPRGASGPSSTVAPTGRRTRGNRWAWVNSSRLPEEGLNELGEAPPPYDPNGRDSLAKEGESDTHTVPRAGGPSTDGGSRSQPSSAASPEMTEVSSAPPPGYNEARLSGLITRPPPAFVASPTSRTAR